MVYLTHRKLFVAVTTALCSFSAWDSQAEQCRALSSKEDRVMNGSIGLVAEATMSRKTIREAVNYWARCRSYGAGFPSFQVGAEGAHRTIYIEYRKIRDNPGGRKRCGWFSGNTITLFGYVRTVKGELLHCGTLARNLAHELGHVLGLADAPRVLACARHIMSDLDRDNLYSRSVMEEECRAVENGWMTQLEYRWATLRADPDGSWKTSSPRRFEEQE